MATIGKKQAHLSINLNRSPGENNSLRPDDLLKLFREEGVEPTLRRVNPLTHEEWMMLLNLAPAALGIVQRVIEGWNKRPGRAADDSVLKLEFPKSNHDVEYSVTVRVK